MKLRHGDLLVLRTLLCLLRLLLLDKDCARHDIVTDHELVADRVVVGATADNVLHTNTSIMRNTKYLHYNHRDLVSLHYTEDHGNRYVSKS